MLINIIKRSIVTLLNLPVIIYNKCIFRYRKVKYKKFPSLRGRIAIFGNGEIFIGDNVKINSCLSANPIGGDTRTVLTMKKGAKLEIGDNTGISNSAIVCNISVKIGKNVKIGGSTKIYDTDFHSLNFDKRISDKDDDIKSMPVEIKDGSFIGAHSIILKGVTIGEKSIIGAGSVVTKNVPDGEIWAGNPAKFIRSIRNCSYGEKVI